MHTIEKTGDEINVASLPTSAAGKKCAGALFRGGVIAASDTLDSICRTLGKTPRDLPSLWTVINGVLISVQIVVRTIEKPSLRVLALVEAIQGLKDDIAAQKADGAASPLNPLRGRMTEYPGWAMALAMGSEKTNAVSQLAAGLEILWGLINQQSIPEVVARNIRQTAHLPPLKGLSPRIDPVTNLVDLSTGLPFECRLNKLLPKAINTLGDGRTRPKDDEKLTFEYKARGQLLGRTNFPSIAARAGVLTHRELSRRQISKVKTAILSWIDSDMADKAIAAVVTALSGLTIELVHQIPLASIEVPVTSCLTIDPRTGVLRTNLEPLAREAAAKQPGTPTKEGGYVCIKPLPSPIADLIANRLQDVPAASTLGELFPALRLLKGHHEITTTVGEIRASWARWLNSQVAILKAAGLDSWDAAIMSNNFGAIPKSKLYYSVSSSEEIWMAARVAFRELGWGAPAPAPSAVKGFGSRAVPNGMAVTEVYEHRLSTAKARRANYSLSLQSLLKYHNAVAAAVGFQMAILLALRKRKVYPIMASIREQDSHVCLHDKVVPGPEGPLPVPICEQVRETIKFWRLHCVDMASNLQRLGITDGAFPEWLRQVILKQNVPLLCVGSPKNLRATPLGSRHVFSGLPPSLTIPPDAGRKALENDLSELGATEADIDAVLRHEVKGQARHSLSADFKLELWLDRISPLIDSLAKRYFHMPLTDINTDVKS